MNSHEYSNALMYMSFRVVIRSCVKSLAIISYLCLHRLGCTKRWGVQPQRRTPPSVTKKAIRMSLASGRRLGQIIGIRRDMSISPMHARGLIAHRNLMGEFQITEERQNTGSVNSRDSQYRNTPRTLPSCASDAIPEPNKSFIIGAADNSRFVGVLVVTCAHHSLSRITGN